MRRRAGWRARAANSSRRRSVDGCAPRRRGAELAASRARSRVRAVWSRSLERKITQENRQKKVRTARYVGSDVATRRYLTWPPDGPKHPRLRAVPAPPETTPP
eukprot:361821-Chlamydomonas_euryale.AAC.4